MRVLFYLWIIFEFGQSHHRLYATGLFYQLIVEVNRLAKKDITTYQNEKDDLCSKVINYINENYDKKLSLDSLSEEFFVSKYHLSHEFKSQYGTGIYKYITLKRLLIARELLADGERVGEVYKACGFNDYTTFFRAFKAEYSLSPANLNNLKKEAEHFYVRLLSIRNLQHEPMNVGIRVRFRCP